MKLSDLKRSGHWPTLLTAFLYFDVSFMVWTILAPQIDATLELTPQQKGRRVSVHYFSGAFIRIQLGLLMDRIGAKTQARRVAGDRHSPVHFSET